MHRSTISMARDHALFAERYRRSENRSMWSDRNQSVPPAISSHEAMANGPRTFAEFPFDRSWQELLIYTQRLPAASHIGIFGRGDETWIRFVYMGESFGLQDGGHRLTLTVDDAECPDAVLHIVQSHFAAVLSPALQD
jgi:hypothetical protein